jgi:hypothetical protein
VLASIVNYFHHLFNPHCEHCKSLNFCSSCENLKEILNAERINNKRLLDTIIELTQPKSIPEPKSIEGVEPVRATNYVPWRVRKNMLEQQDRRDAQITKEHGFKTTEELEEQLLKDNEVVKNG